MSLFIPENNIVYPGQQLCLSTSLTSGPGTYISENQKTIISSKFGKLKILEKKIYIEKINFHKTQKHKPELKLNDIIIGRVLTIDQKYSIIRIISINEKKINPFFEGMLKKEHMGKKNIDKIQIENILLPGDIVRAKIKSLSESRKILLSIEDADLGVLLGFDAEGGLLEAVDSGRMVGKDGREVFRKVACLE